MTALLFRDKLAGTIATVAIKKLARMNAEKFPEASKVIKENMYVDDIIDSVDSY